MSAGTQVAMERKQKSVISANPFKRRVVSTEVTTLGRSNRAIITFDNGDILYTYGNSDQKVCV
jgi:hypothetical protein